MNDQYIVVIADGAWHICEKKGDNNYVGQVTLGDNKDVAAALPILRHVLKVLSNSYADTILDHPMKDTDNIVEDNPNTENVYHTRRKG